MESLYDAIPDIHDVRQLLNLVVRETAASFGADSVVVFLSESWALVPAAWVGLQPQLVQKKGVPSPGRLREYMNRFMSPGRCAQPWRLMS
jgi:hypothetical protein